MASGKVDLPRGLAGESLRLRLSVPTEPQRAFRDALNQLACPNNVGERKAAPRLQALEVDIPPGVDVSTSPLQALGVDVSTSPLRQLPQEPDEEKKDPSEENIVHWGIVGCAGIAEKFCVSAEEAGNAKITAVASRDAGRKAEQKKASKWAEKNAPKATAYESYEALLDDDNVHAVYILVPTASRKKWVMSAAAKKKHVLCEKPIAVSLKDAQEMIDACEEHGVQFMDNTMFMHHPRLEWMRQRIDEKSFGKVKHVVSSFTIPFGNEKEWAESNIRMNVDAEPFGALGDLGWYCIRISLWAFEEMPEQVRCDYLETTEAGVPITCHGMLKFKECRSATFDCSFKASLRQWFEVVGENKTLSCDDFVVNQKLDEAEYSVGKGSISHKALTFPKTSESFVLKGNECKSNVRLVEYMSRLVADVGGKSDVDGKSAVGKREKRWPELSIQTQQILFKLHESALRDGEWVRLDQ